MNGPGPETPSIRKETTVNPMESDIDIWDDDITVDPYPTYAALRELGGVVHLPKNNLYGSAASSESRASSPGRRATALSSGR